MITENPKTVGGYDCDVDSLQDWKNVAPGTRYVCRAILVPESEGGFSAHATRLPGVVSEGETVNEASNNICEAFREAIRCYRDDGEEIPWQDVELDRPKGSLELWMLVNV